MIYYYLNIEFCQRLFNSPLAHYTSGWRREQRTQFADRSGRDLQFTADDAI